VGQLASSYRPYNYGVIGHGAQDMLVKLNDKTTRSQVAEADGFLVYVYIDDHIHRAVGLNVHAHGRYRPYFVLDSGGSLVRRGDFVTDRPILALFYWFAARSEIAKYFGLGESHKISEDDVKLTARIIVESRNAFARLFKSDRFVVLMFPSSSSQRLIRKKLIPYFDSAKVKYFDYTELFDPTQEDLHIPLDTYHPSPTANRRLAERLTRDLGIHDPEGP
jgi:hypothetical protein